MENWPSIHPPKSPNLFRNSVSLQSAWQTSQLLLWRTRRPRSSSRSQRSQMRTHSGPQRRKPRRSTMMPKRNMQVSPSISYSAIGEHACSCSNQNCAQSLTNYVGSCQEQGQRRPAQQRQGHTPREASHWTYQWAKGYSREAVGRKGRTWQDHGRG